MFKVVRKVSKARLVFSIVAFVLGTILCIVAYMLIPPRHVGYRPTTKEDVNRLVYAVLVGIPGLLLYAWGIDPFFRTPDQDLENEPGRDSYE